MSTTVLNFAPSPKILQNANNNVIVTNTPSPKKEKQKPKKSSTRVSNPSSISVARRNARERNRVKQVNHGFATLRQHIPPEITALFEQQSSSSRNSTNKKLSKVETLRMAVEYIRSLEEILATKTSNPYPQFKTEDEENIQPEFFEESLPDFAFEDSSFQLSSPNYYSDASLSPTSSVENTLYQPQFVTLPPIEVIQKNVRKDFEHTSVITSVPSSIVFYTAEGGHYTGNVYIKTESDELGMGEGLIKSEEMVDVMEWWDSSGDAGSIESDGR